MPPRAASDAPGADRCRAACTPRRLGHARRRPVPAAAPLPPACPGRSTPGPRVPAPLPGPRAPGRSAPPPYLGRQSGGRGAGAREKVGRARAGGGGPYGEEGGGS
ncbi:hypothetical protein GCM10017688_25780 [Streptomyces ramulosus]